MMAIYSGCSQIYSPHHYVHLWFNSISIHPPMLLNDVLGCRDRAWIEMRYETEIE
jgi:hypothetical protein